MRKFFKKTEGFTLVELIVVIAILGILAGVGTVGYSGYVKKANMAADQQLLANLNQAFQVACIENGIDAHALTPAEAKATLDGADGAKTLSAIEPADYQDEFNKYYEPGTFKIITMLAFEQQIGGFVEGAAVSFGDYDIVVSKALADAMKNNTFSNLLGAEMLTGRVDTISDIASKLIGFVDDNGDPSTFTKLVLGADFSGNTEYKRNLAKSLNMTLDDLDTYLESAACQNPVEFLANGLVLSAAQKTQGMDTSFLGKPGSAQTIRNALEKEETATEAMAQLALTYGMYTSYMKSQGLQDASQELLDDETFTGMTAVLGTLEGEKPEGATISFNEYMQSSEGKADLNAYLASMQIISDSANQSADATKEILNNGFTDPELVATLNNLFGKTEN